MVMYADDTTFYCYLGDLSEDIINTELTKVSEWLAANKLSLNVKKTKCMVFHTPRRKVTYPEIKINNIRFIKHVFAEHLLEYQMIIQLNEPGSIHYSSKVFTHSFLGFKLYLKNNVINSYSNHCNIVNCRSCNI